MKDERLGIHRGSAILVTVAVSLILVTAQSFNSLAATPKPIYVDPIEVRLKTVSKFYVDENVDRVFRALCGVGCDATNRSVAITYDKRFTKVNITYNLNVVDYLRVFLKQNRQSKYSDLDISNGNPFCSETDNLLILALLQGYANVLPALELPSQGIYVYLHKYREEILFDKYGNKKPKQKIFFQGSQFGISTKDMAKMNWTPYAHYDLNALSTRIPFKLSLVGNCSEVTNSPAVRFG